MPAIHKNWTFSKRILRTSRKSFISNITYELILNPIRVLAYFYEFQDKLEVHTRHIPSI